MKQLSSIFLRKGPSLQKENSKELKVDFYSKYLEEGISIQFQLSIISGDLHGLPQFGATLLTDQDP